MRKINNYFKGVAKEARRVRWPHKKELFISVLTVLVISVIAALVIYFEDWITINILKGFEEINPSEAVSSVEEAM